MPSDRPPRLLVLGGSQGNPLLNAVVPEAMARLPPPVTLHHHVGSDEEAVVRATYHRLGLTERVRVSRFIEDVPAAIGEADLVLSQAGVNAVAEIAAVGRASLLIPYPFAGDHQKDNVRSLVRAGAANVIRYGDATPEALAREISSLTASPVQLARMAHAARLLGRPDAAGVVAADILRCYFSDMDKGVATWTRSQDCEPSCLLTWTSTPPR